MDRIAACACSGSTSFEPTPSAIVSRYLNTDVAHGLALQDFEDQAADDLFGSHYAETLLFYNFAGLLELGVSAGYVDLAAWDGLSSFTPALKQFEEREASSAQVTDLKLVRDLLGRMKEKRYRVSVIDEKAFYAFASYLHLTSALRADESCRKFITETGEQWSRPSDLSFLLSPRHFAEALANGSVGGEPSSVVMSGLGTLQYFSWLTEILDRIAHDPDFHDKLIRHARWSHHILRVRWRVNVWAERMSEWEEGVVHAIGAGTSVDRLGLLRPSEEDLGRLDLLERAGKPATQEVLVQEFDIVSTERLLAEGRLGAAKKQMRIEIARHERRMERAKGPAWQAFARDLVSACDKLVELGDLDTPAVVLAPHADAYIANLGLEDPSTQRALTILARARAAAESSAVPASSQATPSSEAPELQPAYSPRPQESSGLTSEAEVKYRSVGKSSDT